MGDPVPWRGRGHADCRGPGRLDSCGRDGSLFPGSQLPLWTRKRPGKSWAAGWPPSSQRGLRFLRQSPGRRRSVGAQPRTLGGSQAPWCGSSALSTSPLAGSCRRCSKRTLGAGTSRRGQRRGRRGRQSCVRLAVACPWPNRQSAARSGAEARPLDCGQ